MRHAHKAAQNELNIRLKVISLNIMTPSERIPVTNARHMSRLPSALVWKSRETADLFTKLTMPRPTLKSVEFEPTGRRSQDEYEKELILIENHVLSDDDGDQADDAFMAQNNVDIDGKMIVFKTVMRVRTSKDKIPAARRIVEIDLADLGRLAECQRANQRNKNLFKTFEFSGGPGDFEVKVEVIEERKPPTTRKVKKVEYIEEEVEEAEIKSEEDEKLYLEKEEPTLILPTTPNFLKKKRKREESTSDSDDDNEGDNRDYSDPDVALGILKKVKDAKGKVTVDFQRSLKRLRKFNEKRVDCHAKKKLKQAATLLLTPRKSQLKKPIPPKTLNKTSENLLNETPTKGSKEGKATLSDNGAVNQGKEEDLNHLLDELDWRKTSMRARMKTKR